MNNNWVKRTTLFLTAQTITLLGSSIVQYAISWHITLTTKSGLMMTFSILCGFLPQVLISLFAGVWADRFDRKKMIILADGMIAVFTAALAVLFALGHTELWLLFVISAIRSLGAGIQSPAVGAFLTELVPQDKLMRVNGLNSSIQSVMFLLSPVAAGAIYSALGIAPVFWVDVLTAFIGISLFLALKVEPRQKSQAEPQHFFLDMLSGIQYSFNTKWLRQLMCFYLFFTLMFAPVVFLTPLMVARSFGDEPWRLVVHEVVFFSGCILGGLVVASVNNKIRNKVHLLIWACVAFGLATFIMGFSPNFIFYLCVMLPMGISSVFVNTSSMTVLQTNVQMDLMGRVLGFANIIGSGAMPLSMVFFGPLADYMSVEAQLIITGLLMVLISLMSLRLKELNKVGETIPAEGTP